MKLMHVEVVPTLVELPVVKLHDPSRAGRLLFARSRDGAGRSFKRSRVGAGPRDFEHRRVPCRDRATHGPLHIGHRFFPTLERFQDGVDALEFSGRSDLIVNAVSGQILSVCIPIIVVECRDQIGRQLCGILSHESPPGRKRDGLPVHSMPILKEVHPPSVRFSASGVWKNTPTAISSVVCSPKVTSRGGVEC